MTIVIECEVEPLLVGADEAIGVVHAAFRTIDGLERNAAIPSFRVVAPSLIGG